MMKIKKIVRAESRAALLRLAFRYRILPTFDVIAARQLYILGDLVDGFLDGGAQIGPRTSKRMAT